MTVLEDEEENKPKESRQKQIMKIKINGIEKAGKTWRGSTKTKVYYLKRKCENRSSDIGMGKINNIRNGK